VRDPSPLQEDIAPTMARSLLNLLSLLLLAIITLLLAGCFQSEQPRFPLASAEAPLGGDGRYAVYERGSGDRYERQEVLEIKLLFGIVL